MVDSRHLWPLQRKSCASRTSRDLRPVTCSGIACRSLSVDEAVARGAKPAPACAMVQDAGAPAAVAAQAGADCSLPAARAALGASAAVLALQ